MKDFIKNYIDVFDCMGCSSDEKIEAVIDVYASLKDKDKDSIFNIIVKPLLIEYRENEDKNTIEDIEELFKNLLELI